jgi:subtilase family serine protease
MMSRIRYREASGTASARKRSRVPWRLSTAAMTLVLGLVAAGCSSASSPAPARPHTPRAVGAGTPVAGAGVPSGLLTPAQVRAAYDLGPLYRRGIAGTGQTIVIVDPYGSPTIAADLQGFDAAFRLPAPPSFRVIQPAGAVPAFRVTQNMIESGLETSLDVEWAHVIAPAASIVLVETPAAEIEGTSGFPQIVRAEQYVIRRHLGGVVSMSLGATEETFPSRGSLLALRSAFQLAAEPAYRITMVAATGDQGASGYTLSTKSIYPRRVIGWPASDPLVTAVGGTQLDLNAAGARRAPDVAWADSGGGLSSVFAKPAYQARVLAGRDRGIPDISMDASCRSATAVYFSFYGGPRWTAGCGTSLATPMFAAVVALADQVAGHPLGLINPALYRMAAAHDRGIIDVVSGDNDISLGGVTVAGYRATRGYDLVTGLGTVDARYFVPELAAAAR